MQACECIILEDRLIRPSLLGLEGDSENEFFYLAWTEEVRGEYIDFSAAFKEGDNNVVLCEGSTLVFVNVDGQEEELTLLRPWDCDEVLKSNTGSKKD